MPTLRPFRPDLRVPFPGAGSRRYLRAEGEDVQLDHYWHRALARGDVVLAEEPETLAGSTSKPRSNTARAAPRASMPASES